LLIEKPVFFNLATLMGANKSGTQCKHDWQEAASKQTSRVNECRAVVYGAKSGREQEAAQI
jgi:hypothetical protein